MNGDCVFLSESKEKKKTRKKLNLVKAQRRIGSRLFPEIELVSIRRDEAVVSNLSDKHHKNPLGFQDYWPARKKIWRTGNVFGR